MFVHTGKFIAARRYASAVIRLWLCLRCLSVGH